MYAFAFFLFAPLPWILVYFLPPLNHDAAALLHFLPALAGRRTAVRRPDRRQSAAGVRPESDPGGDRQADPVGAPAALTWCVLAWIACGFVLSWRLLRVAPGSVSGIHRYVLPPLFLFLMIVYPGPEFGQREHLMIVAGLPYLLLSQARLEGRETVRGLTLATTLFAGLAFALKPHFLLIPLMVEAAVITRAACAGACAIRCRGRWRWCSWPTAPSSCWSRPRT